MISKNTINSIKEIYEIKSIKEQTDDSDIKKQLTNEYKTQIDDIKKLIPLKGYISLSNLKENVRNFKLKSKVYNTQNAINIINSINLFSCLNLNAEIGERDKLIYPLNYIYYQIYANSKKEVENEFNNSMDEIIILPTEECTIFEVYKIKESEYKIYYSKKNNEYFISIHDKGKEEFNIKYNFLDLYCVLLNLNKKEAIYELINLLNIEVLDVKEIVSMYKSNIDILENRIQIYKGLYKYIGKAIPVLIEILKIALLECYFHTEDKALGYIFFSQRFLAQRCNLTQSTITPYINGFCLMGFINKKEEEATDDNYKNKTSIYRINQFTEDLFCNAEEICKILKTNKISLSYVNNKSIVKLFGKETADLIIKDKNIIKGSDLNYKF